MLIEAFAHASRYFPASVSECAKWTVDAPNRERSSRLDLRVSPAVVSKRFLRHHLALIGTLKTHTTNLPHTHGPRLDNKQIKLSSYGIGHEISVCQTVFKFARWSGLSSRLHLNAKPSVLKLVDGPWIVLGVSFL